MEVNRKVIDTIPYKKVWVLDKAEERNNKSCGDAFRDVGWQSWIEKLILKYKNKWDLLEK